MSSIKPIPFNLPSAKNLSTQKAVDSFVPTELFWRLLESDTHDIILGTRGSGKTMLLRMLTIQHLSKFATTNARAEEILSVRKRYGIYLPLGIDWCVAYHHEHPNAGSFFTNGVNLVCAEAFLEALGEVIALNFSDPETADGAERDLSELLSDQWFRSTPRSLHSFAALRIFILQQQSVLRDLWLSENFGTDAPASGFGFKSSTLFAPIRDAIQITNLRLGLPSDHRWILCLDELENLNEKQTANVLTLLRGSPGNLIFKITTQPYTLSNDTTFFNDGASAVDFRDYELTRLQYDPDEPDYQQLVDGILSKRIGSEADLATSPLGPQIFGKSTFADRASKADSDFTLLKERILSTGNRDSSRKKVPVAALRTLKRAAAGHTRSEAYSGWKTLVRLTDGNPGIFVRLLNELGVTKGTQSVQPVDQHSVAMQLAESWLEWSYALYPDGARLHQLLDALGGLLQSKLHSKKVEDDAVQYELNRVRVNLKELEPEDAEAFRVGARHSLLVAESPGSNTRYPAAEGIWRLSYSLAPKYWLIPRRGRVGSLRGSIEGRLSVRQIPLGLDQEDVENQAGDTAAAQEDI